MREIEKCTNGITCVTIYLEEGRHVPVANGSVSKEVREAVERFRNSELPAVYIRGFFEKILSKESGN
ncbi:MAG: hypothetical protein MJY89_06375 [Bacteroidales bacterium]|nr:hypothetical protein [Bacteroidales bacterium]